MKRCMTVGLVFLCALLSVPPATASTWARQLPPNIADNNWLEDVAVVPRTAHVWAVGSAVTGSAYEPLTGIVSYWNGHGWETTALGDGRLYGVTATSDSDVWAVGEDVTWHYDGATWTRVAVPAGSTLRDAVAISPTDVWAAGSYLEGTTQRAAVFHRTDSTWTVDTPILPSHEQALNAITRVPGTRLLWAVGETSYERSEPKPLSLRYTGTRWRRIPVPTTSRYLRLLDVAAVSRSDAVAVGSVSGGAVTTRWDGSAWVQMETPLFGTELPGISRVPGTQTYWAVGHDGVGSVVRYWDGATWESLSVPQGVGEGSDWLFGVTASRAGRVSAVGYTYPYMGEVYQLLALRGTP